MEQKNIEKLFEKILKGPTTIGHRLKLVKDPITNKPKTVAVQIMYDPATNKTYERIVGGYKR